MRAVSGTAGFQQSEGIHGDGWETRPRVRSTFTSAASRLCFPPARKRDVRRWRCRALRRDAGGKPAGAGRSCSSAATGSFGLHAAHSAPPPARSKRPTPASAGRSTASGFAKASPRCRPRLDVTYADELQRQCGLLVRLPAEIGSLVHGVEKQVANIFGRANGDEQAVHARTLTSSGRIFPMAAAWCIMLGGVRRW